VRWVGGFLWVDCSGYFCVGLRYCSGVLLGMISGSRCCSVVWLVLGSWVVFLGGAGRVVVWLLDVAAVCGEGWWCR